MAVNKKTTKKSKKSKFKGIKALEPELLGPVVIDEPKASDKALAPSDPVAAYMAKIRKYPLLTKDEEKRLAIKYYETGDPEAAQALVTANLRFVVKVAADYSKFGAKLIDLIQEGNMGLMHAVKEYNPYKGAKVITYAVWWIRGYIQEYLMRQYSMVRIGTTAAQRKLFYQLQKHRQELERLAPQEAVKMLSGRLGVSESDVVMMTKRMSGRDVSLDAPIDGQDGTKMIELQSADYSAGTDEQLGHYEDLARLSENVEEVKETLNPRELELLEKRILAEDPITLQDIASQYGVSREAVRQMETRVIGKIKTKMLDEND